LKEASAQIRLDTFIDAAGAPRRDGRSRPAQDEGFSMRTSRTGSSRCRRAEAVHLTFHLDEGPRSGLNASTSTATRPSTTACQEADEGNTVRPWWLPQFLTAPRLSGGQLRRRRRSHRPVLPRPGFVTAAVGTPTLTELGDSAMADAVGGAQDSDQRGEALQACDFSFEATPSSSLELESLFR